jgi:hypothetical protein
MLLPGAMVGAAIAINVGYVIQHGGLATSPRVDPRRPLATVAMLLRSRRWVAGALLGYAGLALEAVALTAVPLSSVQAAIGGGLVVVAVLSRAQGGQPLGRAAPLGAALAVAALVVGAAVTPAPPAAVPAPAPWALAAAAALVTGLAGVCVWRLRGATGLAIASGLLYGMTSIAMAVVARAASGTSPGLAAAAVALGAGALVTGGGFLSFQRALQHGQPLPVVTAMMAATDVVATAGGLVLLGDPLASGAGARAAQLAALAAVAVSALAVHETRRRQPVGAEEPPGLLGGGDRQRRPWIRWVGAGPRVRAAGEAQVGDLGRAPAARPLEA